MTLRVDKRLSRLNGRDDFFVGIPHKKILSVYDKTRRTVFLLPDAVNTVDVDNDICVRRSC